MTTQTLTFDVWKSHLYQDCQRQDKLADFNRLPETTLEMLWEEGTDPSVQAIDEQSGPLLPSAEEIVKRRAIIRANPSLSTKELCEMLDHRQIPVPRRWKDADISWWTKAYRQSRFRGRVHNVISKDRTRG